MTVMSKALGGGFPLAATLVTREIAASLSPGMHGCTFGGSPVAAAAGLWMLKQVNRRGLLGRVRKRGAELAAALAELVERRPSLAGSHGMGLLQAVELAPEAGIEPRRLLALAREEGLLVVRGGERAVRLLPPLTVTSEEIQEAVTKLDAALARAEKEKAT
jgi:acetylornithine/succinyldiaminopimelate/putrescine aminotransferase